MASTEREEVFPAPPPYEPVGGGAAPTSHRYAPPSGPPPPNSSSSTTTASTTYAPPPGPPPSESASAPGPPPLAAAPPIYEPFSFSSAYAQTHGSPPRWHAPPAYHIYFDSTSSKLTFHLIIPSTEPPCACGTSFECQCGRRRPTLWTATRIGGATVRFERFSPNSATTSLAFEAGRSRNVLERNTTVIKDHSERQVSSVKKKAGAWITRDLEDKQQTWQSHSERSSHHRLELTSNQGLPLAIFRPSSSSSPASPEPGRVELTSLAWGRMPSDELECDYAGGCDFHPLYGFVFRCSECSQDDTFDICEAHLADELVAHNPKHHFHRQPRPYTDYDDAVRETPLLRAPDLAMERKRHELILCSLAVVLLLP